MFSQILIFLPLIGIYEAGIRLSMWFGTDLKPASLGKK
jgi:Sec-independent protein secretion pathway component TatC